MVKKIDRKIVAYQVKTRDEPQQPPVQDDVVHMHETVLRPERLMGTTYKLKTPEHVSEHSLFITINDIILNEGRCTRLAVRSRSSSTPRAWSTTSGSWR